MNAEKVLKALNKILLGTSNRRFFWVLIFPCLSAALVVYSLALSTMITNRLGNVDTQTQVKPTPFVNFLADASSALKMPLSLIHFDVYALNNVYLTADSSNFFPSKMNIELAGEYTGGISIDEKRLIYHAIDLSKLSTSIYSRSFEALEQTDLATSSFKIAPGSAYYFYIWPTIPGLLVSCLYSVLLMSALLTLYGFIFRFTVSEDPFKSRG